jgi:Fic family protein
VISYGFVFIHPFEDGNGRIHRFLIHNILSLRGAVPAGLMFPVSAAMLKNRQLYDDSLEAFSKPMLKLVTYEIDDNGQMSVSGDTAGIYRYIDMTSQAEALFDFVKLTIEHELTEELEFLSSYDETKKAIQEIVDMPDRQIDLFIRLCLQENGRLSARKRESHFSSLTDEEIALMEEAVAKGYKRGN